MTRHSFWKFSLIVLITLVGFGVGGCGNGEDEDTPATPVVESNTTPTLLTPVSLEQTRTINQTLSPAPTRPTRTPVTPQSPTVGPNALATTLAATPSLFNNDAITPADITATAIVALTTFPPFGPTETIVLPTSSFPTVASATVAIVPPDGAPTGDVIPPFAQTASAQPPTAISVTPLPPTTTASIRPPNTLPPPPPIIRNAIPLQRRQNFSEGNLLTVEVIRPAEPAINSQPGSSAPPAPTGSSWVLVEMIVQCSSGLQCIEAAQFQIVGNSGATYPVGEGLRIAPLLLGSFGGGSGAGYIGFVVANSEAQLWMQFTDGDTRYFFALQ